MSPRFTRREIIKTSALAGVGFWLGTESSSAISNSPNEKIQVACIGVGGRGGANVNGVKKTGAEIVALADVDEKKAGGTFKSYSKARKFHDYRKMLDKLHTDIDAVVVSTPDHTHFHPSMMAMNMGKHLYCEKPMAHNVWEIRTMTNLAREKNLKTQLGVQRHTIPNVHRVVELIKTGAIGEVKEVYAWVGGSRGMPKIPKEPAKVPSTLKYDLWIGPAKLVPYAEYKDGKGVLAPYNWRFWWDYGTGETGNWGCHVLDIPFWALELDFPTRVDASGPEIDPDRTPKSMQSHFVFPKKGDRPEVKLHWGHGKAPKIMKEYGIQKGGTGCFFVGTKGALWCDFGNHILAPKDKFEGFKYPEKFIPKSPGFYREWTQAIKGDKTPPTCNFDYSGPMAETVILGNVAYRAGEGFDWNAKELKASSSKAQSFIREEYRKGWEFS